jgi:glycosyltransferase involved in cell wall biosynthesis
VFFSVVIPAYNEERYLPRCLESLRAQNYPAKEFEIIVVDNASTDATPDIARRFGARVVYESAKGIAHARQRGFEAAQGEFIANTDADTAVPNNWLSRMAWHFGQEPHLGGVYGPVYWFDGRLHEEWIMRYPVTWALSMSNRINRSW